MVVVKWKTSKEYKKKVAWVTSTKNKLNVGLWLSATSYIA